MDKTKKKDNFWPLLIMIAGSIVLIIMFFTALKLCQEGDAKEHLTESGVVPTKTTVSSDAGQFLNEPAPETEIPMEDPPAASVTNAATAVDVTEAGLNKHGLTMRNLVLVSVKNSK